MNEKEKALLRVEVHELRKKIERAVESRNAINELIAGTTKLCGMLDLVIQEEGR